MLALRISAQVADWLANNIWLWLLVHNKALSLLERAKGFLLDAVYEVVARGNIMNEADDLAGGPDLGND